MAAAIDSAQLTALAALLETARDLVTELAKDGSSAKLMRAFRRLDPDERQAIATAFDRAVGWRKVNEALSPINGVRLKVNSNPRFFVRVVDPEPESRSLSPDPDEVLVGALRILRQAHLMCRPEAIAVWEPALRAALAMLEPEERDGCAGIVREFVRILATPEDESGTSGG
jgi:hypothetical protein